MFNFNGIGPNTEKLQFCLQLDAFKFGFFFNQKAAPI